jgi:hypothetical protein
MGMKKVVTKPLLGPRAEAVEAAVTVVAVVAVVAEAEAACSKSKASAQV